MACSQYTPSSWFNPNSSQPNFTSNYTLGSSTNLAWWGGTPYVLNQTQDWRLILAWSSDTDPGSALSSGHGLEMTSEEGWIFTYGYTGNPSWVMTNGDTCGYTALGMAWQISPDIDISSNRKFKIFGLNMTDTEDITTATSPGFSLLPSSISSTSSIASTAASRSSSSTSQTSPTPSPTHISAASTSSAAPTTTASTSSATPPTNPTSISRGAKAGIGVGCTLLACLVLLGVFVLMRRRRRPQTAHQVRSSANRKPELDGRAAKKPIAEISGGEKPIPEISGGERHELNEQQGVGEVEGRNVAPVEMPGLGYGSYRILRGQEDDT